MSGFYGAIDKTQWYGSELVIAPRTFPPSKRCSECSAIVEKIPLNIRNWQCNVCQVMQDRDLNAAKNLLIYSAGSSPEIYACGDTSGGANQKFASHVSLKQELTNEIFVYKL